MPHLKERHMKRCATVCFFVLLLTAACTVSYERTGQPVVHAPPARPTVSAAMSADDLAPYQVCTKDEDCVFATNGCCDCANGGKETAVNKDFLDEFEARFDCKEISCTMIARVQPCGCGTVRCEDFQCTYSMDGCPEATLP
jgi:hypothetical protein